MKSWFRHFSRRWLGLNPSSRKKSSAETVVALLQYILSSSELMLVLILPGYARYAREHYAQPVSAMVIGAQKAGTTWLHTQFLASDFAETGAEKECHHFDLGRQWTIAGHASQFDGNPTRPVVEFAPDYGPLPLWRIRAIAKLFPDLRVLLVLRDPIERAWSAAKMETGFVTGRSMSDVPVQELAEYVTSPRCRRRSDYFTILNRWASVLGPDRIFTVLYDDLVSDADLFLTETLRKLVPDAGALGSFANTRRHEETSQRVFEGESSRPPKAILRKLLQVYGPMALQVLAPGVPGVTPDLRQRAWAKWSVQHQAEAAPARGKALFVSGFMPNPKATSAGQRLAYAEYTRLRKHHTSVDVVTFVNELDALDPLPHPDCFDRPPHYVRLTQNSRLLSAVLHPTVPFFVSARRRAGAAVLRALLAENAYTAIYADFSQGLAAIPPSLWPVVEFRQHDVVSKLYGRIAKTRGLRGVAYVIEAWRCRRWEAHAWRNVSAIRTLALDDPKAIRSVAPDAEVSVEPPSSTWTASDVQSKRRPVPGRILLWGNMARQENIDAVRFAAAHILPRVQAKIPAAHLQIVGAHPDRRVRALSAPSVQVVGFVNDPTDEFAQAAAALAPLRLGSGVKLKVVETLAAGLPTIATTVGAEGIGHHDLLAVRDTAEDLADALIEVLSRDCAPDIALSPAHFADVRVEATLP